LSSLDKSLTNASYEIEIDPETQLPVRLKVLLLAAIRGETECDKAKRIVGGRHVAFEFEYRLSQFGKVEKPQVPFEAMRLLAKK
jgi:hypothetical protein